MQVIAFLDTGKGVLDGPSTLHTLQAHCCSGLACLLSAGSASADNNASLSYSLVLAEDVKASKACTSRAQTISTLW